MILPHLDNRRGVFGKGQVVTAFGNQRFGGFLGFVGPVPGVDPFYMHPGLGVDGLDAQRKGVDVTHHLGNRKRADITDLVGFGQRTGHHPVEVIGLIELREIGAHIFVPLEPGTVHEMLVRIFGAGFDGIFHVAETGCKDDVAFFALNQPVDDTR